MATIEDFEKIDMRVGRIVRVDPFPEAEVLVLGALDSEKGVILLRPDDDVELGDRIA